MFLNLATLTGMEDINICRISFIDLDIYINYNKIIIISNHWKYYLPLLIKALSVHVLVGPGGFEPPTPDTP